MKGMRIVWHDLFVFFSVNLWWLQVICFPFQGLIDCLFYLSGRNPTQSGLNKPGGYFPDETKKIWGWEVEALRTTQGLQGAKQASPRPWPSRPVAVASLVQSG